MPVTNMAKVYLDLEDSPKDDSDFYLIAHVDKNDRVRDAYIACIRIYPHVKPAIQCSIRKERSKQGKWVLVQEE